MTPDALATRVQAFMEAAAKAAAATGRGHLFLELQRSNAILLRLIEIKLSEDALVGGRIDRRPVRQLLGKKLICSSIAPRAEPIARWRHFLSL